MLNCISHTEQNEYYRHISHISINNGKEACDCGKAELNKMKLNKGGPTSLKCRNRTNRPELKQGENGRSKTGSCPGSLSGADIATLLITGKTDYVLFTNGSIVICIVLVIK